MNKRFFLSLAFTIIFNLSINAHNEFYSFFPGLLIEITIPPYSENDILRWQNNSQIPLYEGFLLSEVPDDMDPEVVDQQFQEAKNKWSFSCIGFTQTSNSFGGADVFFSSNSAHFPIGSDIGGFAPIAVFDGKIVADPSSSQTQFPATQIIFNSTNYPSSRNFKWTTQFVLPDPDDYLNFQNIALHELGHIIGMAHCSNSGAVMYQPPTLIGDIGEIDLSNSDIQGINIICQNAAIFITINPLYHFFNKQHFFFEYSPEILLFSQKQPENKENKKENTKQNLLLNTEKKLFTVPENKREGVKK